MRNPVIGDRVVTNNLEWGVIESINDSLACPAGVASRIESTWFNVRLDSGRIELQDASRMSRIHPFGDKDPGLPVSRENCKRCGLKVHTDFDGCLVHEHDGLRDGSCPKGGLHEIPTWEEIDS